MGATTELRDMLDAYGIEVTMHKPITKAELARENAKLRELASGLYKCWVNEGCEGCPMQDGDGWCVRDIRLRELGVEVVSV